jgi:hypothetical protein
MDALHAAHPFHPQNIVNVGMIRDRKAPTGLIEWCSQPICTVKSTVMPKARRLVKRANALFLATAQQSAAAACPTQSKKSATSTLPSSSSPQSPTNVCKAVTCGMQLLLQHHRATRAHKRRLR